MKSEKSLVIHVDGSSVSAPGNTHAIGWAVIACHDDQLHERHGGLRYDPRGALKGAHEHVAFIEAVKYVSEKGFDFKNTTILCDDMLMGYAQSALHRDNFRGTEAAAVRARIAVVVSQLHSPETAQLVLDAIEHSTIHKLKGHSRMVYQERADYLAKEGARAACGIESDPLMGYEAWLQKGIRFFDPEKDSYDLWKAPFVDSLEVKGTSSGASRRTGVSLG